MFDPNEIQFSEHTDLTGRVTIKGTLRLDTVVELPGYSVPSNDFRDLKQIARERIALKMQLHIHGEDFRKTVHELVYHARGNPYADIAAIDALAKRLELPKLNPPVAPPKATLTLGGRRVKHSSP